MSCDILPSSSSTNRTILELKPWVKVSEFNLFSSTNRTILELKRTSGEYPFQNILCTNRTILELKLILRALILAFLVAY